LKVYFLAELEMDHFDKEVLQTLEDNDHRRFQEILSEISFPHNTLREHLNKLIPQNII